MRSDEQQGPLKTRLKRVRKPHRQMKQGVHHFMNRQKQQLVKKQKELEDFLVGSPRLHSHHLGLNVERVLQMVPSLLFQMNHCGFPLREAKRKSLGADTIGRRFVPFQNNCKMDLKWVRISSNFP